MSDYKSTDSAYDDLLQAYADLNKHKPTQAETVIWDYLSTRRLGCQFVQQHVIGDCIADFVCQKAKIIVEIDGQYHLDGNKLTKDTSRTAMLQQRGFTIVRFTSHEVLTNSPKVFKEIKQTIMQIILPAKPTKKTTETADTRQQTAPTHTINLPPEHLRNAWAVDAACSGNPGPMEYQAVDLQTGQQIFHFGPMHGTNNIGEFLAIVHALALMQQKGISNKTIYSDSYNAILWVKKKQCKTKLERNEQTQPLFDIIARAEKWLRSHRITTPVIKWETKKWGEIPADFGRKSSR